MTGGPRRLLSGWMTCRRAVRQRWNKAWVGWSLTINFLARMSAVPHFPRLSIALRRADKKETSHLRQQSMQHPSQLFYLSVCPSPPEQPLWRQSQGSALADLRDLATRQFRLDCKVAVFSCHQLPQSRYPLQHTIVSERSIPTWLVEHVRLCDRPARLVDLFVFVAIDRWLLAVNEGLVLPHIVIVPCSKTVLLFLPKTTTHYYLINYF